MAPPAPAIRDESESMSTTLQVNLSDAMQSWLSDGGSGNGVSAYAILYGSTTPGGSADTPLAWQSLVSDGAVQGGGTVTLDLTTDTQADLYGGKVYFIIQSLDGTTGAIDPATLTQSSITWANAQSLDYRYDSIEVSLTGTPGDAANLTSIEGFGIGMSLEASTGSRSYSVSAGTLFGLLADAATDTESGLPAVTTFTAGGLAGDSREAVSPAIAVVPDNDYPLYAADDWNGYIDALKTPSTPIVVTGYFNGAGDLQAGAAAGTPVIWRNAGFFSYALEWRERDGSFWLIPTEGSQIQGAIKLSPEALANSVYSTLGTVELYEIAGVGSPFELYPGTSTMNVGANNAWGQVLQQLTLGLTAGYLESTGASENAAVTAPIDLNKNYNWSPVYAYGTNTDSALGPDVAVTWDPYSQLFFQYSNSYGTQYADALMNAFTQGGPQLSTYDNGNVRTMTVTLYADSETPPTGAYTPPVINDYVAGTGSGGLYVPAEWHDGNPTNITLNFNPGDSLAQSLVLRDDVQIGFRMLTGYDGTTPQWQEVTLGGSGATPWQNWTFSNTGGTYAVSGNGGTGQTSQSLVLTGLPMADAGVGWYQIVVKGGDFEKIYNLYTTTFTPAPTTGDPDPIPQFTDFSTASSAFGIDGLATLTPGATQAGGGLLTFSVNVTGVSPTLDLALMQPNTASGFLDNQLIATAPVVGTRSGAAFVALAGQTADVHDGKGNGVDLSVTSGSGRLAFGWTGLNTAADTSTWTQTYTNLVQGKSIAVIDIAQQGGGSAIAPLHAKADLAGGWQTAVAAQLGNGVYDVTMTAYAPMVHAPFRPDLDVPLTNASATMTLTVALSELDLQTAAGGQALRLQDDVTETQGNWITVSAGAGRLPEGIAVALYATDAAGNFVGADGSIVSSIDEAVLGWVGSVASDDGTALLTGTQMVYLGLGQELHFAIQSGERNGLELTPVAATDAGDGTMTVALGSVTLTAQVDNTLSAASQAASVQRIFGLPLIELEQGQSVDVHLTGSTANRNTLGFVRLDLDQATRSVSIDGIAYEEGDAFRSAVRDSLDAGFRATVGASDFTEIATWTVSGEDGYYAPVLITQSGEIFIPGNGNADGREYIRIFGENTFGFEDLTAAQQSDFDYNDMVMRLVPEV
jgi:hypothetical protein